MAKSENGWEPNWVDQDRLQWVKIPGAEHVSLQFMRGQPLVILRAFAADFHAHVEPLRDADSAAYTSTNSVKTSNHLNGTGMDLNWEGPDRKRFRLGITEAQAYPGDKARKLRELLTFYEDTVYCGGFWSIQDWMHFQMGYNTYGNQRTADFIARKIRADGFSTFNRGNTPNTSDAATVLSDATGLPIARAREILPAVRQGLTLSNCTDPNRIAMWLAQIGHESDGFNATEEYEKNGRYAPYIGRTWIQITWDYNYRDFSKWAYDKGLVDSNDYFVRNYRELADIRWAGIGPAWYWTVQRPNLNSLSDALDLYGATRAINGGLNGIDDRKRRYDRAKAVGSRLLTILQGEDELSAAAEKQIAEIHAALLGLRKSKSIYATPGEPAKWSVPELIRNMDGRGHQDEVEKEAARGDQNELHRIVLTAKGLGEYRHPEAISRAQRVLADIEREHPTVLETYISKRGAL